MPGVSKCKIGEEKETRRREKESDEKRVVGICNLIRRVFFVECDCSSGLKENLPTCSLLALRDKLFHFHYFYQKKS